MPWSESLPQFSLAGTLLTVLLLFFAAFGEPLLGRRAFAWLSRRENGDERALGLLYAVTMAIHVLWGLLVLVVLLLSPNLNLVDLGLRTPDAFGPIVGAAIGGTIALAAFWVLVNGLPTRDRLPIPSRRSRRGAEAEGGRRGRKAHRGRRSAPKPMTLPQPGHRQYLLLPRTGRERALAAGMAVTGGVFGELLYRGLFITLVASMDVPLWIAAVLSVVLFSLAHAYQGWWGLLSAGFSGTLFTVLYLGTGSLVVPVVVHVALNLRSVVFPPASEREAAEEALRLDDYYDDEYEDEYADDYADDEYGRTGEFEAVDQEAEPVGREPADAQAPPRGLPPQGPPDQGPPVTGGQHAGTPPYGSVPPHANPHPYPPQPPRPQGPPPGYGQGHPQGPQPQGPPPMGHPQGPPPGYPPGPGQPQQRPFPPGPSHQAPPHQPPPPQGFTGHPPGHGAGGDTPGPHSPYRD
ncbi:CPBP family intramembrane glutamic endopeptidase [Nocardiopsis sp. B62]|uniref:CPBP family intramembrane glutamic endopeptidase n=1 Tax=Nocardiopsis sp. B62 TaxID=2824874 RepID=UPI001B36D9FB|nr:CPBP family intramembrane glutamic endopeptidase [Nocardiopsis sp. B62]MBQ1081660.1 CPBP family intramembrane metalloprotease [Nocardiopsis sp. B62]